MATTAPTLKKENFHVVLQQLGKTVFRPGGSQATAVLHQWANLQQNDTALELSAGMGTGGIALAMQYPECHVVLTDMDTHRLALAQQRAQEQGLGDRVQVRQLDMRHIAETLDRDGDSFGCTCFEAVIVEASLTHEPDAVKEKILMDLKPYTHQILLHEIGLCNLKTNDNLETIKEAIQQQVGSALAIGFHPITIDEWRDLLTRCGYTVTHLEYGPIRLLHPLHLLQDEGPQGVATIAWNLIRRPALRQRVLSTKRILDSHKDNLVFVILRAVCNNKQDTPGE